MTGCVGYGVGDGGGNDKGPNESTRRELSEMNKGAASIVTESIGPRYSPKGTSQTGQRPVTMKNVVHSFIPICT